MLSTAIFWTPLISGRRGCSAGSISSFSQTRVLSARHSRLPLHRMVLTRLPGASSITILVLGLPIAPAHSALHTHGEQTSRLPARLSFVLSGRSDFGVRFST